MSVHETQQLHRNMAGMFNELIEQREEAERLEVQAARWHETCELVSRLANNESKIATALIFAAEPDRYFTAASLYEATLERQGPVPVRLSRMAPVGFCKRGLEQLGYVVSGSVYKSGNTGTTATGYKFNEDFPQEGIASLGLVAGWSLKWPDISVRQALGATNTTAKSRAAETRSNIFMELLTCPGSVVASGEVEGISHVMQGALGNTIQELKSLGFVNIENAAINNDRVFMIINNHPSRSNAVDNMGPEAQAVYKFLAERETGTYFTKEELLNYVIEQIKQSHPDYYLPDVRRYLKGQLANNSSGYNRFPGIKRLNRYNTDVSSWARIQLLPEYVEAIRELMEIMVGISDRNPAVLAAGVRTAAKIINTPDDVKALMVKGKRFSSNAQSKGPQMTRQTIMKIILDSENPLSGGDIHERLKEMKFQLGKRAVYAYLRQLQETGEVIVTQIQPDPTNGRKIMGYCATLKQLAG